MKKILILTLVIFGTTTFTMSASGVTIDDCIDYMNNIVNKEDNDYGSMMNDNDYRSMMNDNDYRSMMNDNDYRSMMNDNDYRSMMEEDHCD